MIARYDGDDDALRESVAGMGRAGVDLAIVSVPKSEQPSVMETIAAALA
jgi:hypothetical protein